MKQPPKPPVTLYHLPNLSPRPADASDHTGKRRGTMTAIAWCRPCPLRKGTVWLCRCDCGLYEYRRPGTWQARPHPDDRCDVCVRLRAERPNSLRTAQKRRLQWEQDLRDLGITDEEITQLQAPGMKVDTKGKTAAEIREQIAKGPA
ncbi:hypothetical protein PS3A_52580 [Pseudomonas sp. 3A(2025)]